MADPISLVVLGAVAGGAAGKFVEKAWDSGEKWLKDYFKNHKEKSIKAAETNSLDFLNELANRVKQLEESKVVDSQTIDSAQDHPDFSIFLQKAILTSAQTKDKEKHIVLARLVVERLKSPPETVFSLASKMACDAISFISNNQLRLLGMIVNLYGIRPNPNPPANISKDQYQDWFDDWITKRMSIYQNINIGKQDLNHLESLSCLKNMNFISRDINELFTIGEYKFDFSKLKNDSVKIAVLKLWKEGKLESVSLTTTGSIIGVMISDELTLTNTSFIDWE